MDLTLPIVLFLGFFAFFLFHIIKNHRLVVRLDEERVAFFENLADDLGWDFEANPDGAVLRQLATIKAFDGNKGARGLNRLRGGLRITLEDGSRRNFETIAGDYECQISAGEGSVAVRFSYVLVRLPSGSRHELHLRKHEKGDAFERVASMVGVRDINFESAEFSRAFWVTSDDKKFAYDVVHPRMIDFLMESPASWIDIREGLLCLTSRPRSLRVSSRGEMHADTSPKRYLGTAGCDYRWKKEHFSDMLRFTANFLSLWPLHLINDKP